MTLLFLITLTTHLPYEILIVQLAFLLKLLHISYNHSNFIR